MFHDLMSARRAKLAVVTAICGSALLVTACGSSDPDTPAKAGDAPAATATASGGGARGSTVTTGVGTAQTDKVYAPGVPTLDELYKGTEGAPPSSGPPVAKNKTVIFVSCGQAAPGCSVPPTEMKRPTKLLGWNYRIIDGALNANNGWAAGLRQAIAAKPDAIVLHGQACPDVKQPLVEAKAAKIPVFGIVSPDCDDPKSPGGPSAPLFTGVLKYNDKALNTSGLYKQIGQQQADYAIAATQGKAKVIRTEYQSTFGFYQQEGQDEELAKCPDCKVVASVKWVSADSAPGGQLLQKFRTVLAQHPEANAVIYNFDSTSTSAGLAKALTDTGRKDVVGVSAEGYSTSLDVMRRSGGIDGVPSYSGKWMAWGATDMLNRYFNGKPMIPEGIGARLVDRTHNLVAQGQDYKPPIDYESGYKKLWNVGG